LYTFSTTVTLPPTTAGASSTLCAPCARASAHQAPVRRAAGATARPSAAAHLRNHQLRSVRRLRLGLRHKEALLSVLLAAREQQRRAEQQQAQPRHRGRACVCEGRLSPDPEAAMRPTARVALGVTVAGLSLYGMHLRRRASAKLRVVVAAPRSCASGAPVSVAAAAAPPPPRSVAAHAAGLTVKPSDYPTARRDESIVDAYPGGASVADPYRWRVRAPPQAAHLTRGRRRAPHLTYTRRGGAGWRTLMRKRRRAVRGAAAAWWWRVLAQPR
jgi:hypothetical protein